MNLLKPKLFYLLLVFSYLLPTTGEARARKKFRIQTRKCAAIIRSTSPDPSAAFWQRAPRSKIWTQQPWGRRDRIRVMTMNMYNIYAHQGREASNGSAREGGVSPRKKTLEKVQRKAAVFFDVRPDIAVIQEIEPAVNSNAQATLDQFARIELKGKYVGFTSGHSNDRKGMESGFLVKAELLKEFNFEVVSFSEKQSTLLGRLMGQRSPVFTGDFALLRITKKGDRGDMFYVFDPHLKSLRPSFTKNERRQGRTPENVEAARRRVVAKAKLEIAEIVKIITQLKALYPRVPFMISGDFNRDLESSPEMRPFYDELNLREGLTLGQRGRVPYSARYTSIYFPIDGERELSQLLGNFVSPHLQDHVLESWVYRFVDDEGSVIRLPETYQEREGELPTDHYPVVIDLSTKAWR